MDRRFLIWFWSRGGGGSRFAVQLASRLSVDLGLDVTLSLRADDPAVSAARSLGLSVLEAAVTSDRRRPLASLWRIAHSARTFGQHVKGADVVIVPMNFAVAAPLALTTSTPLVYCAHDPIAHRGDYAPLAQWTTQRVLLARADAVVALSHYAASQISGLDNKMRVEPLSTVFPPGTVVSQADSVSGKLRLLVVGRMIEYKGLDALAGAFEMLSRHAGWEATIAGDGPALTDARLRKFRDIAQVSVDRRWLDDGEIEELVQSCDIVVAPYAAATQSGVVAHALSRGKPCLVSPVGALPEQVGWGQAGWIANAATADALYDVLQRILSDKEDIARKAAGAASLAKSSWQGRHWRWLAADDFLGGAARKSAKHQV